MKINPLLSLFIVQNQSFKDYFRIMKIFEVLDTRINYYNEGNEDYISLTDMLKSKDGEFFISDWLRNRNTIEFLGIWEELHNPNFNYGEFAIIQKSSGFK